MSIREEASFYSDSGQPPASPNPLLEDDFPTSMRSNTNNNNQMDDITEPNSTTAMNVEDPNNTTGNTRSTTNNNNSTNPNQTNNSSRNVFNLISQTFAGYLRGTGATPVATTGNPLTQNGANNQRGSNSGSDRSDSIAVDPRLINDPFIQGPMVITQADGHPSRNIVEWLGFWFQQRYMSHPSPQRDDLLPMNLLSDGLPNGVTEPPSVTTNENDPDLARAIESSINQNQANNNNLKKPRVTTMNPIIAKANIKKESIHATIHKSTTPISSSSSSSSCVKLSFLLDLVTDCTVRLHIDAKDNLPNKILCKKVVDEVKVIGKRQLGYPITMVIPEILTNNSITNIDTSSAKVETDNTAKKPNIEIKVESESQATDSNCYPIAIEVEYAVSNPSRTSNGSHHKLVIFCKVEHHMTSDNSDESHQISIKPSYTKFVNELGMAFLIQDIYGVSEPRKRKKTGASNGKAPPPMIEDGLLPNAVVISNDTGIRGTMDQTQESVQSSNQNPPILDSSTLANNKIDNVDTSNNGNDNSSSKSSSSTNLANTRDCVICLAEEKNTVVLPCRHMCLCHDCAEVLRNQSSKCPICRQPFHSLLYLVLDDARESMEAPAALAKINNSSIISPF